MSGLAVSGGDPDVLEQLASQLEAAATGADNLGGSTRQVTASIRADAHWTGDAADAYTGFTGNVGEGATAVQAPLSRIASAVRDYAGYLRTAQQKAATYASAVETAQVSGNDSAYMSVAQAAGQEAAAAISDWQAAGDRAAAAVSAAAGQLGEVFGPRGPVLSWLGRQPMAWDTLAGMAGAQLGPEILTTPLADLGPLILTTPPADLGPEILLTPPADLGPLILTTPPADLGPEILKTPPGELGPLINYAQQGGEGSQDPNPGLPPGLYLLAGAARGPLQSRRRKPAKRTVATLGG